MKLEDYLQAYQEFSGKTSDVNRQLSFAGIAVIWVFGGNAGAHPVLVAGFVLPAIAFVASLALDLLQYLIASVMWKVFHRIHEKKGSRPNEELKAPTWLSHVLEVFFYLKVVFVIAGYVIILARLSSRL